ncbi:hypothetical protein GCM10008018_41450 [Paenibacillus marchantiophytorum]|uniref:EAL domain-containing protein n=1 Tax=Paenibacillus marchantiophytorum TaxID=1619310 RepID=A0ABQ1EWQ2_9BACL|nr:EAL domain-containing protein [Paenibacillus marchantiophytorum]GFZ90840.1 hypothetical protein GCM10008018_41450 [Paenibacillus marchantiophytorum]
MLIVVISALLYAIPMLLLIRMALEVYRRNRYSSLNKIAAISFLVAIIPYIGNFLISWVPASYTYPIVLGLMDVPSFFLMCFMVHFALRLTGRFRKMSKISVFLLCYGSLVPSVVLLLPLSWFSVELIHRGPWEIDKWSRGLQFLTLGTSVYAMSICLMLLLVGFRYVKRYDLQLKRKQIRIMCIGYVMTYLWGVFFSVFDEAHDLLNTINYPDLAMLSMLWFGYFLRYAVMKYDFLPSINQKYQMLYDLSPVSIIVVNQEGIIVDLNPQAAQLLECLPNELMLEPIGKFVGEENTMSGGAYYQTLPVECSVITRSGKVKSVKTESHDMIWRGDPLHYVLLTEMKQDVAADDKVQYLVEHDAHTGLLNRGSFLYHLENYLVNDSFQAFAVILLDMDKFKQVDAALGYGAGDSLLKHMADLIQQTAPRSALISRIGEDEFALIVPAISNQQELESLAQSLLDVCNHVFHFDGKDLAVTASMGICLSPLHSKHAEDLMQYADMAMYEARSKGPGDFVIYEPSLRQVEQHRYLHSLGIKKGIDEEEFVLHYQPLIEMQTGHIIGAEALIRWVRPGIGFLPPDAFMLAAEDDGSILEIGYWVLNRVCEQLKGWEQEGLSPLPVSVNLSKRQFLDPHFLDRLEEVLERTKVRPAHLCLEIKEQTALLDVYLTCQIFENIQNYGVKLNIDDVGAGFPSVFLLHKLPFDAVKLDPTFLRDMLKSEMDQATIHRWIALSHSLGKRVIAKGVEEFEQWELLSQLGCDEIQGYFLSKPLDAGNIVRFMNQKLASV